MNIINIDFSKLWRYLLPNTLRSSLQLAWGRVLLIPLIKIFYYFKNFFVKTGNFQFFDNTQTYYPGQYVIDKSNQFLYQVIKLYSNPAIGLNNTEYFVFMQSNFIGTEKRIKANTQKWIYEYMLNLSFKWPYNPLVTSPYTYIYIDLTVFKDNTFYLEDYMHDGYYPNIAYSYMDGNYALAPFYYYTIYVPNALWTTLGSNNTERENKIRYVANKYNIYNVAYRVLNY